MAVITKTPKGYMVIQLSVPELQVVAPATLGVCDICMKTTSNGYLIPVLNSYYCSDCFRRWQEHVVYYPEDAAYEKSNLSYYLKRLKLVQPL